MNEMYNNILKYFRTWPASQPASQAANSIAFQMRLIMVWWWGIFWWLCLNAGQQEQTRGHPCWCCIYPQICSLFKESSSLHGSVLLFSAER